MGGRGGACDQASGSTHGMNDQEASRHSNRPLLKTIVQMLTALDLYSTYTEPRLLAETGNHYQAFAEAESRAQGTPGYLQACSRALEDEAGRCGAYLDPGTLRPLVAAVEHQVLSQHRCEEILSNGFQSLVSGSEHASLELLARLLGRVGRTRDVREALKGWVTDRVGDCVGDPAQDRQMVMTLLELKAKSDAAVERAGGADGRGGRRRDRGRRRVGRRRACQQSRIDFCTKHAEKGTTPRKFHEGHLNVLQ